MVEDKQQASGDESNSSDVVTERTDQDSIDKESESSETRTDKNIEPEENEVVKGLYRCYTGNEYQVLLSALDTKDHQSELVIYRSLSDGRIWVRPKEEFLGFKEVDGQRLKRFELMSAAEEQAEESFEHQYKRALADYQNLIKQQAKEKEEFVRYALNDFLQDVLPVYDHLKLSLKGLDEKNSDNPWVEGVRHVLKQFKELLTSRGVEEIKTTGEKFDHDIMEAMGGQGELVKEELSPGYKLRGKLIRAAKVIVG